MAIINSVISGGGSTPATQYGVNLKGWCGDINQYGNIRTDQAVGTLSMPGLTAVWEQGFRNKFVGSTGLVGTVSFPDVTWIDYGGFENAFVDTGITGVNFGQPFSCGANSFCMAFARTPITALTMCVVGIDSTCFTSMCEDCSLLRSVTLEIDSSVIIGLAEDWGVGITDIIADCFVNMIQGCTNCVVHLYDTLWQDFNQWYEDQGEPIPYATAQDWATFLLDVFTSGSHTGCSVVFDIDPT